MIAADKKKILRGLYKVLTDEQFEKACSQPDPYLAGMCMALGVECPADAPAPQASGKTKLQVRWQIGRAARMLIDAGKTRPTDAIRSLDWSHGALYTALAVYDRHPDGHIPEMTVEEATGYVKTKVKPDNQPGVPTVPAKTSAQGIDAAILDLKGLAKKSGLPLKAEQIASVAAKRGVNPLVLMGAWGNTVLQQGAPTSQQIIEALQKELATRTAQLATLANDMAAKEERLAAQQKALDQLSDQVSQLQATVNDLSERFGQFGAIGAKLADFFRFAGVSSPRTDVAQNAA